MAHDETVGPPRLELDGREAFDVLFERSTSAMLFTAFDATILAANPAACRLYGRSEEELRRTPAGDLIHPDDRDQMVANAARVVAEGRGEARAERRFVR